MRGLVRIWLGYPERFCRGPLVCWRFIKNFFNFFEICHHRNPYSPGGIDIIDISTSVILVPVRGPTAPGYYLLVLPGTTVLLLILILIPSTVVRVLRVYG